MKASDILHITEVHVKKPIYYLETKKIGYGNPGYDLKEAQALIDLWDSAEDLKKCVEILKDALKCLRTHYTPENMLKATNAISESEKF